MSKQPSRRNRKLLAQGISILLTCSLLVGCVPTVPVPRHANRVQPILLEMATESPQEIVRVIVQDSNSELDSTELAQQYGGKIVRKLGMINAYVAEIPAGTIPSLNRSEDVRWISLDAEVIESSQHAAGQDHDAVSGCHSQYSRSVAAAVSGVRSR